MSRVHELLPLPDLSLDPWDHAVDHTVLTPYDFSAGAAEIAEASCPTPTRFREVLGGLDLSRTVVTACVPDGPVGFANTSFASLSVNPPLVTMSPARTSLTWPQIRRVGRFCVNVLAEETDGWFARFSRLAIDRFEGVPWTISPGGCPVLQGVTAWVECELSAEYDGGDHRIVVGEVSALKRDLTDLPPLFLRSSYGSG